VIASVSVSTNALERPGIIDCLPTSGLTPRLYDWSVFSEHLGFVFLVFFISLFCLVTCGRFWRTKIYIVEVEVESTSTVVHCSPCQDIKICEILAEVVDR